MAREVLSAAARATDVEARPVKRRRLSPRSTDEATTTTTNAASASSDEAHGRAGLSISIGKANYCSAIDAYPSPSSTVSPPPFNRRYRFDRTCPLPPLPPLPPICSLIRPHDPRNHVPPARASTDEDGSDYSDEEDDASDWDPSDILSHPHDFEPTDKERIWEGTMAWHGVDNIFPPPDAPSRGTVGGILPPCSPGPLALSFSHDAPDPRDDRWRAFAPELDLASYNPPRPQPGRTFTKAEARRWLIRRERCRDIGECAPEVDGEVWTEEERRSWVSRQRDWWDAGGTTVSIDETLLDRIKPIPVVWRSATRVPQ